MALFSLSCYSLRWSFLTISLTIITSFSERPPIFQLRLNVLHSLLMFFFFSCRIAISIVCCFSYICRHIVWASDTLDLLQGRTFNSSTTTSDVCRLLFFVTFVVSSAGDSSCSSHSLASKLFQTNNRILLYSMLFLYAPRSYI